MIIGLGLDDALEPREVSQGNHYHYHVYLLLIISIIIILLI